MAADPYFEVRAEVESSLLTASTLHASYLRILQTLPPSSHTSSEELSHALVELKSTLSSLSADVEELDGSVRVLEQEGVAGRFGVSRDEVARRRDWVEKVKRQVEKMQREAREPGTAAPVSSARATPRLGTPPVGRKGGYPPPFREDEMERGEANDADEFELEHQSVLREQQDSTLGRISGAVSVLRDQAGLMGRELFDQTIMLEEMDEHVDRTESRLGKATRKMDRFIQQNRDSKSSWCILLLIIVLFCLLLAILFV